MAVNQEVIDAINATIAPNNVKGITADSLRNLLLLMAENSGGSGGSGEGALRVMVPFPSSVTEGAEEGATEVDFTPETVALMATEIPEIAEVGEEIFAHNAKVYAQLMEKVNACEGVSVIVDASKFTKAYMGFLLSITGQGEIYGTLFSEPVIVTGVDSNLSTSTGIPTGVSFNVINKETSLLEPFDSVFLNEDGSLKFVINQEETTEPTE